LELGLGFSWNVRTDQHSARLQTSVHWFFEWGTDTAGYHLVYSLTCQFSKFSNDWFWHMYNYSSQFFKKKVQEPAKESPVLFLFFLENHQFVEVFEKTKTEDSMILQFFPKNWRRRFFESEMFKEPESTVLSKIQRTAQHCSKPHHPLFSQSIFWCVRVPQILLRGSITRSSKPRNVLGGSNSARKHLSSTWLPIDCSSSISSSFDSTFVLVFCVCKIVCFRCSWEYWVWSACDSVNQGRGSSFLLQISKPVHPFACWAIWWVSLLWQ